MATQAARGRLNRTGICVALRTFVFVCVGWGEHRPGRAAGAASSRRPSLRFGSTAVLARVARRELTSLAALGFVQTSAPSPEHEARCARGHASCAPRRRLGATPATRPGRCERLWSCSASHSPRLVCAASSTTVACKDAAGRRSQRLCGGEERSEQGRARSALRELTRRGWSSVVNAVNEASSATGPVSEHRSAVRPPGGPPQRSGERRPAAALHGQARREKKTNVCNAPKPAIAAAQPRRLNAAAASAPAKHCRASRLAPARSDGSDQPGTA